MSHQFRKNQVLYLTSSSGTGEKSQIKVYFMKEAGVGVSKIQNLRTGNMFTVETRRLKACDDDDEKTNKGRNYLI